MDIKDRNRKVAVSRWSKVHSAEKSKMKVDNCAKSRICGFLAGDGSILVRKDNNGKLHYVVRFFPDHESLAKIFEKDFHYLYGKHPRLVKKRNHFELICYSKPIVEDLMAAGNFGVERWRVPSFVLEDKQYKLEWLRSFFDSEAYVGENYIKLQTVNKSGMADVVRLLTDFGLIPSEYTYEPKNKNWNKVYILILNKGESSKFLGKIGFGHKLKMEKLRTIAGIA